MIEPVGGVDGRVATGLERPDVFNWFRYLPEQLRALRPDVVVLGFGGNDDHGYMTGLPKGVSIDGFDTPSWRKEYGRRVGGLMDAITRAGGYVVWIGLPDHPRAPIRPGASTRSTPSSRTRHGKRPRKVDVRRHVHDVRLRHRRLHRVPLRPLGTR